MKSKLNLLLHAFIGIIAVSYILGMAAGAVTLLLQ